jgi:hypothetical protein
MVDLRDYRPARLRVKSGRRAMRLVPALRFRLASGESWTAESTRHAHVATEA